MRQMRRAGGDDGDCEKGRNRMKFLYEVKNHTVKILRCYGAEDGYGERGAIVLPASICGRPVTELGDYIFSAEMRERPAGILWEERDSKDGEKVCTEDELNIVSGGELCGRRVRSVFLPATIEKIGRYAFYNCDCLKELHFTASISDIGAGAFNGCRKITDLYVDVISGRKSCLKEILADLNETLIVYYRELAPEYAGQSVVWKILGQARLLFPLFYEEAVENTPARILETHVHGCGHRYRYCFQGTEFRFRDYDALFIHARTQEEPEHVAALAMGRLRFPYQLSAEAGREYAEYLLAHLEDTAACLLKEGGMDGFRWLVEYFSPGQSRGEKTERMTKGVAKGMTEDIKNGIKNEHAAVGCLGNEGLTVRAREEYYDIKKPILGETGFDKLVELTNRAGHTEATSFLMDARYRCYPPKRKRFEL